MISPCLTNGKPVVCMATVVGKCRVQCPQICSSIHDFLLIDSEELRFISLSYGETFDYILSILIANISRCPCLILPGRDIELLYRLLDLINKLTHVKVLGVLLSYSLILTYNYSIKTEKIYPTPYRVVRCEAIIPVPSDITETYFSFVLTRFNR